MIPVHKKGLLLFLLCCFFSSVKAEDGAYVELLIFRHAGLGQQTLKSLLETQGVPNASTQSVASFEFSTGTAFTTKLMAPGTHREHVAKLFDWAEKANFSRVTNEKQHLLADAKKRLEGSSRFGVLYHVSWRQPLLKKKHSIPISVLSFEPHSNLSKVNAELSFSRYFRLQLELWYSPALLSGFQESSTGIPEKTLLIRFSEVMEDDKLYYLDHQLLGVLAIAKTE